MFNQFINIKGVSVVSDKEGNISILKQKDNIKEILDQENEIEALKNTIDTINKEYTSAVKEYEALEKKISQEEKNNRENLKKKIFKGILFTLLTIITTYSYGKIFSIGLPNLDLFVNILSILSGGTMFSLCLGNIINTQKKYNKESKKLEYRKETAAIKSMSTLRKRIKLEEELHKLISKKIESNRVLEEEYDIFNINNDFPKYQQIQEDIQTSLYYPDTLGEKNIQRLFRKRR